MSDVTNLDRAGFALTTLEAYRRTVLGDKETAVQDLLCDLMHFCDKAGIDFEAKLKTATGAYKEELAEESDQFAGWNG